MVFVMVDLHGLLVDDGLQGIGGIGQRGQGVGLGWGGGGGHHQADGGKGSQAKGENQGA